MDYQSFQCLKTLVAHETDARALAISPDGKLFISGGWDKTIKFWQLATGKLLQTWQAHRSSILALAITPDGQTLASSSWDKTVKLYDFGAGQVLHTIEAYSETSPLIPSVVFSQDGKTLYTGTQGGRGRSWDVETGKKLGSSFPGGLFSDGSARLALGEDGRILASSYLDILQIRELPSCKRVHEIRTDLEVIASLAITPDSETIVSGHQEGDIYLWHARSGERVDCLKGHQDTVKALAIDPNGQVLASGGNDKTINLWDLKSRTLLSKLEGHSDDVMALAFSPDGRTLVSGSMDRTIKLWGIP